MSGWQIMGSIPRPRSGRPKGRLRGVRRPRRLFKTEPSLSPRPVPSTLSATPPSPAPTSTGAAELRAVRYRFQGREWSAATGLANFRMRWYDAETGRWLSKDPIGLSGGLNLYAFCKCNPIFFCDPKGSAYKVVGVLLVGVVAGAGVAAILGGDDVAILSSAFGGGIGALIGAASRNIAVSGATATVISSSLIEYSKGECGSFRRVVTQTIVAGTLSYFGGSYINSFGEGWLFGAFSGSVPSIINRIPDILESAWNSIFGE